ncbi:hypothetical protein D6C84_09800 [Aureobasidium pullulans]|uniref:Carrier protein Rim2p/Mrs12p n=1 Tax=Aureobasidium pullulans TaxID=5580 RepID=A0A4S9X5K4_AURPU|nr:hypothetical protein D6C84_09800 [Aureobasidium pullulans]
MAASRGGRVNCLSILALRDANLGVQGRRYSDCDSYGTSGRSTHTFTIESLLASSTTQCNHDHASGVIYKNQESKLDVSTKATRVARIIHRTWTKHSRSSPSDRDQVLHVRKLQSIYANWFHVEDSASSVHTAAAVTAGILTGTATNPIWLIKTRMQLDNSSSTPRPRHRNSFQYAMQIFKQEGIRGFYRGLSASCLGVAESALHLVLYERIKEIEPRPNTGRGSRIISCQLLESNAISLCLHGQS